MSITSEAHIQILSNETTDVEVKDLVPTIREIKAMLSAINFTLVGLENKKLKDKDGRELQLGQERVEWMMRFEAVMQDSYENATSFVGIMKEITAILGTDNFTVGLTYDDLKAEIDNVVATIKKTNGKASETKDMLQSLATDFWTISGHVKEVLQQADAGFMVEFSRAHQPLGGLTEKLNEMENRRNFDLAIVLGTGTVGAIASFAAVRHPSTPTALVAICAAAPPVLMAKKLVQKNNVKNEMLAELAIADATCQAIQSSQYTLREYVEHTMKRTEQVAEQLNTLGTIWQNISFDILRNAENLQMKVSERKTIDKIFWDNLDSTRETYRHLIKYLEIYLKQSRAILT